MEDRGRIRADRSRRKGVFVEISSGVQDRGAPSGGGHAPRLTKMLVSTYAASAGIPLLDVPIAVVDRSGVDSLLSMLTDGSRRISIVCVAPAPWSRHVD